MDETRGRATLAHRNLARWVLQSELGDNAESVGFLELAEDTCGKLASAFAPIITRSGTDALMARALFLSRLDFPLLSGVTVGGPGEPCLNGLRRKLEDTEYAEAMETILAIMANAIALLSIFIGDELVVRRLDAVWPGAFNRTRLSGEEGNDG